MKNLMDKMLTGSIVLNAFIWAVYGIAAIAGFNRGIPSEMRFRIILCLMALAAGGALLLFYFLALKRSPRWYYLLLMELMFIIILTLADQFGWPDAVILATSIFSLAAVARKIRK